MTLTDLFDAVFRVCAEQLLARQTLLRRAA